MDVDPRPGLQVIPLPDGKVALVVVSVVGPKSARSIAAALVAGTTPPGKEGG